MPDLSNESLLIEFDKLKQKAKRNSIFLILLVLLFVFCAIYFTRGSSSREIKDLQKENKLLKEQFSELKQQFSTDSAANAAVAEQIGQMRGEREILMTAINNTTYLLGKFKPLYEKVNNYQSVPANDSLSGLFNKRFTYK